MTGSVDRPPEYQPCGPGPSSHPYLNMRKKNILETWHILLQSEERFILSFLCPGWGDSESKSFI